MSPVWICDRGIGGWSGLLATGVADVSIYEGSLGDLAGSQGQRDMSQACTRCGVEIEDDSVWGLRVCLHCGLAVHIDDGGCRVRYCSSGTVYSWFVVSDVVVVPAGCLLIMSSGQL